MPSSIVVSAIFIAGFTLGLYARFWRNPDVENIAAGMLLAAAVMACSMLIENSIRRILDNRKQRRDADPKD